MSLADSSRACLEETREVEASQGIPTGVTSREASRWEEDSGTSSDAFPEQTDSASSAYSQSSSDGSSSSRSTASWAPSQTLFQHSATLAKPSRILTPEILSNRATTPFNRLTVVDLSYLNLDEICGTDLEPLTSLEILILGHNNLTDVSSLCDARLSTHLYTLDLSFNQLRSIKPLRRQPVLGSCLLNNNQLTWGGVAPFLQNTCVTELFLAENPALLRSNYRVVAGRMALGLMVLDGKYLSVDERTEGCLLEVDDTIPMAPALAIDKSREPKIQDLKVKFQCLNRVAKQASHQSKGSQLLALTVFDLEEQLGLRGAGGYGAGGSRKAALPQKESRRLRYLAHYYTTSFNMLQACPSQSLFEYAVGQDQPEYYNSSLLLGQAILHCAQQCTLPGSSANMMTNSLPFCIAFWKEHLDATQCLIQLLLAALQFDLDLLLIEEVVRRAMLWDVAQHPDRPIPQLTIIIVARAVGLLPSYARLSFLLLLTQVSPVVTSLLADAMSPTDDHQYLPTLALSAHSMMALFDLRTADQPEADGDYAVSVAPLDQPFTNDFVLPGLFVELSRHPLALEKQRQRRREYTAAMARQEEADTAEITYLERRAALRHAVPPPRTGGSLMPPPMHLEKKAWLKARSARSWTGVAAVDDPESISHAQFCSAVRMPAIGERVTVPFYSADGSETLEKPFTVQAMLQGGRLFRLVPVCLSRAGKQERQQREIQAREQRVAKQFADRNAKASYYWRGSELHHKGKVSKSQSRGAALAGSRRPLTAAEEGNATGEPRATPDTPILVQLSSLVWNMNRGLWKLVDRKPSQPSPGAAPRPSSDAGRSPSPIKGPPYPDNVPFAGLGASPNSHNFLVPPIDLHPHAPSPSAAGKLQPLSGTKEKEGGDADITFLTAVPLNEPLSPVADTPRAPLLPPATPVSQLPTPYMLAHPFTRDYMENTARLKERMARLWALRPVYEPPVDPETGQRACSASLSGCKRGFNWEAQSNFFLPSLFRTKLVTLKSNPPAPPAIREPRRVAQSPARSPAPSPPPFQRSPSTMLVEGPKDQVSRASTSQPIHPVSPPVVIPFVPPAATETSDCLSPAESCTFDHADTVGLHSTPPSTPSPKTSTCRRRLSNGITSDVSPKKQSRTPTPTFFGGQPNTSTSKADVIVGPTISSDEGPDLAVRPLTPSRRPSPSRQTSPLRTASPVRCASPSNPTSLSGSTSPRPTSPNRTTSATSPSRSVSPPSKPTSTPAGPTSPSRPASSPAGPTSPSRCATALGRHASSAGLTRTSSRSRTPASPSIGGKHRSNSALSLEAMRSPLGARTSSQRLTRTQSKGISKTTAKALVDAPAASVESFVAPDTPRDGSPQSQQTASMAAAEDDIPKDAMQFCEDSTQTSEVQYDPMQASEMPFDITNTQACSPDTTSASATRPTTSTDYHDDDSSMGYSMGPSPVPSRGTTPALHKEGALGGSPFPSRAATPCDSIPDLAPVAPVQDRLWSSSIPGTTPKTVK
mmetsp:Transcript_27581/g.49707  ORF Transcript_27581/g.49707 Transcript_27581/m.49707 type:complete len:1496 (-) Transcript_27581:479-4966(-)